MTGAESPAAVRRCKHCPAPALAESKWRICAECRREYWRRWQAANPERCHGYVTERLEREKAVRQSRRRRCVDCHLLMHRDRRIDRCPRCAAKARAERAQEAGRHCYACTTELPVGRSHGYCAPCRRAYLQALAKRPDRPCSGGCGAALKAGTQTLRCPDCARKYRWRRSENPVMPPCRECGEPSPPWFTSGLCRNCESIRGVERRALAKERRAAGGEAPWPPNAGR